MGTIYALLKRLEAVLAGTFLLLMVVLIFTGGVARMLGHPLNWTIDLSTASFAWGAFLCADVAWRNNALMSIDVLTARLPARAARALTYANYLIIAGFLVYVIYAGTWLSWTSRARAFQGIPSVSYSWVTASIVVGGLLLLLTTLIKVHAALKEDGLFRSSSTVAR
ncbi:TRAP transporter small permease [Chelativorans salis]|uniref:TRAP transporter small permease protein n=1 Tax=Chelativorans salis TaxID=2978478 RepID=A0ABT2LHX5_9HYPH|nr:TRAP transporter small permease subunit [Chelativorans sp. EGI FJ00035]MCT7374182.1 TRAP transporter small permease subunit [Chelativorans sp. EGI FJ00035]